MRSKQIALNNLSGLYHALERYEDSARLDAEILDARRSTLGEDHPDTIRAMNNLAVCLTALKQFDWAQAVWQRAIQLVENVWGPTHPEFAVMIHGRESSQAMGDLKQAEAHLLQALSIYDRSGFARYRPLAFYQLAQVNARWGNATSAVGFLAEAIKGRYAPEGSSPAFRDDPQLMSLRGYSSFEALFSTVSASLEEGKRETETSRGKAAVPPSPGKSR